jgi:hypothetical protein
MKSAPNKLLKTKVEKSDFFAYPNKYMKICDLA